MSCSFAFLRVRTDTTAFLVYSHVERQDLTKSVSPALLAVPGGCLRVSQGNSSAVLEASVSNLFLPLTPTSWLHQLPPPTAGLEHAVAPGGPTTPIGSGTVETSPPCPSQVPRGQGPLPWSGENSTVLHSGQYFI